MGNCSGGGGPSAAQQEALAAQQARVDAALSKIKHKFIIMSGKGGVGKSSVSVNLAIALAGLGNQVGIMDVDLHGPDVPRMLGLEGMLDLNANRQLEPMPYSDHLKAVSVESLIASKDEAIIWRGPAKNTAIQQFLGDVNWGELDFLIVDSPPGTGDEPLSLAQTIKDAQAVIVTTPQEISLSDVRKSINFCKTVGLPVYGLIENMSGFECPHCSEVLDLFGNGGGEKTAQMFGIPFLGKISFDNEMVHCGDAGISYQDKHADSRVTRAFIEIAKKMTGA